MQHNKKIKEIQSEDISRLLVSNFSSLMGEFFEMQSSFLSGIYKRYGNIETANIILCLTKITHLQILRLRERKMYHDVSLENFWNNYNNLSKPTQKIISIVKSTAIPKETVRRKIKELMLQGLVSTNQNSKEYYLNLLPKYEQIYLKIHKEETEVLSKFIYSCAECLKLPLNKAMITNEIRFQFSFYWFHFLSCQLNWLNMWQNKIKDIDLILITLQAVIPTLKYLDHNENIKNLSLNNLYLLIGHTVGDYKFSKASVSAASISDVTGIPRATCVRKLEILRKLGLLERDSSSKRFFITQSTKNRTKSIFTKENINTTVEIFSNFLAIILNTLRMNENKIA